MKHLLEGGTNVYINNPGHITKMAAMPIYGHNSQTSLLVYITDLRGAFTGPLVLWFI